MAKVVFWLVLSFLAFYASFSAPVSPHGFMVALIGVFSLMQFYVAASRYVKDAR